MGVSMLLMAEADADTAARGGEQETVMLPDAARTQAAEWAWSQDSADEELYGGPQSWGAAWSTAGVLLVVFLMTGLVVAAVAWVSLPGTSKVIDGETSWVPTTTPAGLDEHFLEALRSRGVEVRDPVGAVSTGGMVCSWMRVGRGRPDAVRDLRQLNPDRSDMELSVFVDQSIRFYCPQYGE